MSDVYTAAVAAESKATQQEAPKEQSKQETVQAEPTQEAAPVEVKPQPNKKKFKVKVDGNEEEMELDLNDEATLVKHLQMSKAASKRMNEAAVTRKQAEQFIQALQNDPMKVLSNPQIMGDEKFQEIAEAFLAKKIQEQLLTPEERKRIEMEEKLRAYEESEKKTKAEVEAKQTQQLEEHYAQQYQKTIIDALQTSSLPKNPFTVRRMAELMSKNLQHGLDLEPQYLAQLVKEDYQKELISLIGSSDADQIIALFGEQVTNKIRKADLAKLKSNRPGFSAPQSSPKEEAPVANRKMRADEYENYLRTKK
jgi:hypothetical protein